MCNALGRRRGVRNSSVVCSRVYLPLLRSLRGGKARFPDTQDSLFTWKVT